MCSARKCVTRRSRPQQAWQHICSTQTHYTRNLRTRSKTAQHPAARKDHLVVQQSATETRLWNRLRLVQAPTHEAVFFCRLLFPRTLLRRHQTSPHRRASACTLPARPRTPRAIAPRLRVCSFSVRLSARFLSLTRSAANALPRSPLSPNAACCCCLLPPAAACCRLLPPAAACCCLLLPPSAARELPRKLARDLAF